MDAAVDWQTVGLAATIATALATGVSTLAALWWRRLDKTEPDWLVAEAGSRWVVNDSYGNDEPPNASGWLANVGDASAYRVTVVGLGCRALVMESRAGADMETWLVATPGERRYVWVGCDTDKWDKAALRIEWTQSPTWRRVRHRLTLPLVDIAPKPEAEGREFDEGEGAYITTAAQPAQTRSASAAEVQPQLPAPKRRPRRRHTKRRRWQQWRWLRPSAEREATARP